MTESSEVACSLGATELVDRQQEWRSVLEDNTLESLKTKSGAKLRLRFTPATLDAVEKLVEAEKDCCPWINWSIVTSDNVISLEASAETEEGALTLAGMFRAT